MKYRDLLTIAKRHPNCCESWLDDGNGPDEGSLTYKYDEVIRKAHSGLAKKHRENRVSTDDSQ